jgi:ubiquinone/menaquinone biosynthesis C-methylase UbiE
MPQNESRKPPEDRPLMSGLESLTSTDIQRMSYNELIGLVRETNRPPGGRRSISEIAVRCMLRPESNVLDIGTSTGTTAVELARLTGSKVVGIDINATSLEEARRRAAAHHIENRVTFREADATRLPFEDESFDLVFCGNVTSLIQDKGKALAEYRRVLRFGGVLAAIPMYYVIEPDLEMVEKVRKAIQVEIPPIAYREEALSVYTAPDLERFDEIDFRFRDTPRTRVHRFCDEILERKHLTDLSPTARETLSRVYLEYMLLFRDNLAHMGFTILLFRKSHFQEDPELFIADRVS